MEPLTLKPQHSHEDTAESWDDDPDFQGIDELQFRNVSTTTVGSASASQRRDSNSSRISTRSDRDSTGGGDEDWQILLPTDDEKSAADAINTVKSKGIPIPQNVPTSALLGGTIKRLGGRRIKKALVDDWAEDIEIPKAQDGGLKLKKINVQDGEDGLRQFSADFPASPKTSNPQSHMTFIERMASAAKSRTGNSALDKFRDNDDDDDFGDVATIKLPKNRTLQRAINFKPPPAEANKDAENIEEHLELPVHGKPLRLSLRREAPKTPLHDDGDMEWAEGSLGTRFGGTRREARSNHSSSISAFSPSASSCLTGESEDEGLECLVLPDGPLKFDEALKMRFENVSPDPVKVEPGKRPAQQKGNALDAEDDFETGIEIGDGEVFDCGKLTLNRNIKHATATKASPAKRPATSLTFTNKLESCASKIPRPQPHDRNRSVLEPVSESGGPIPHYRRPGSRMGGHSANSSTSAIPAPLTPSSSHSAAPSTPSRRGLNTKSSRDMLRTEPTTNTAQYLKAKRSVPVMRSQPSPVRSQPSYQRSPSRGRDYGGRQGLTSRPKTPTERSGAESSLANSRKAPVPFLPAGTSSSQSHHISIKTSRHFNRPNSSDSNESGLVNRPTSRLSNPHHRPVTPTGRRDHAPEALIREAAAKRTLTKPARRRAFGDGNELEAFDDLPTSASTESKFVKQPVGRGAPKAIQMRSKLGLQSQNGSNTTLNELPPPTPLSPQKQDHTPRFARDTNASRVAREHRIGSVSATLHASRGLSTVRETGAPLASIGTNRKATLQQDRTQPYAKSRSARSKKPTQRPGLIQNNVESPKTEKGMTYNPITFRWEGNEGEPSPFDVPVPRATALLIPKSPTVGKAVPALISNVGATKGVQMQGGMVFDPQRMCWLKMAPEHRGGGNSNLMSPDPIDEDDDPFAGLDDLYDGAKTEKGVSGAKGDSLTTASAAKSTSLVEDEWLVGEEFDVGPEFVKRQRAEEERWRAKVEGWVGEGVVREGDGGRGGWKWAIREKIPEIF